jgi:predicted metal-dependent enzyme (double-stranded beta helix superfamily)
MLTIDLAKGDAAGSVRLIIKGQGTLAARLMTREAFCFVIRNPAASPAADSPSAIRLRINDVGAYYAELWGEAWREVKAFEEPGVQVDADSNCSYWYSLDCHNRQLGYGKGELRKNTRLADYSFPLPTNAADPDPYAWVALVEQIELDCAGAGRIQPTEVWRDPVTVDPAMVVLSPDRISMEDIARNQATVAANLTPCCQQLYANVAGGNFELNTSDFPQFVDAIEASIANPLGWCYQKLKEKADEFGKPDPEETYLRITMGTNQGESPGIPFVMEIWPPGHYSPLHNHAGANAIIRVLNGEITVRMFAMLSAYHRAPFMQAKFRKDDVTWISPRLNQTHQLYNHNTSGPTCITVQCYMYGESDETHYEYFDYLSDNDIKQFTPNSDCDFLTFKQRMKDEWATLQ